MKGLDKPRGSWYTIFMLNQKVMREYNERAATDGFPFRVLADTEGNIGLYGETEDCAIGTYGRILNGKELGFKEHLREFSGPGAALNYVWDHVNHEN